MGLFGTGQVQLEERRKALPDKPTSFRLRPRSNGPFTFVLPKLVGGNPYEVRVTKQPTNPAQVCSITNASGTIEDTNVTNVEVQCV